MSLLTHSLLKRARDLIGAADPKAAIDVLLPAAQEADSSLGNELIMQQARIRDITTRERQGVAAAQETQTARQQVGFALLDILSELERFSVEDAEPPVEAAEEEHTPQAETQSDPASHSTLPESPDSPEVARPDEAREVPARTDVFISYSHRDSDWLERLQRMLSPIVRDGSITLWDDTRIKPGGNWLNEIRSALAKASVAVLLVSDHFLSSDFIMEEELPPILSAAESGGLRILWVYLSASYVEGTPISAIQAAFDPSSPLEGLSEAEQNEALLAIAREIKAAMDQG